MQGISNTGSFRFLTMDQVLAKLVSSIGDTVSQRKWDVVEWVAELMQFVPPTASPTAIQHEDIKIEGFRKLLPWNVLQVLAVTYKEQRLPYNSSPIGGDPTIVRSEYYGEDITTAAPYFEANPDGANDLDYTNDFVQYKTTQRYDVYADEFYQFQGDNIVTSFESGTIRIHYIGILTCDNDLPRIPNVFEFLEAIRWYVLRNMMNTGYRHPYYDPGYCEQMFERRLAQAANTMMFPTVDQVETVKKAWVRLVDEYDKFEDYGMNIHNTENRLI